MCGRFGRFGSEEQQAFADHFAALAYVKEGWKEIVRYNCLPSTDQLVVRVADGKRRLELAHWGIRARGKASTREFANAVGEEAATKFSWAEAFRSRRCLIPASLFYEWTERAKQPYAFALRDRRWFGMGGLWEPTAQGIAFLILTTPANALVAPVLHRMPLILRRDDESTWLDPATEVSRARGLVQPYAVEAMTNWAVGRRVNSSRNEGADLIEPVSVPEQQRLF